MQLRALNAGISIHAKVEKLIENTVRVEEHPVLNFII